MGFHRRLFLNIENHKTFQSFCKQIFIRSGYQGIVDLLIKHSADINAKNYRKNTALIFAAINGNIQMKSTKIDQHNGVIKANI